METSSGAERAWTTGHRWLRPRAVWPCGVPRAVWPCGVPRAVWPCGVPRAVWPCGVPRECRCVELRAFAGPYPNQVRDVPWRRARDAP